MGVDKATIVWHGEPLAVRAARVLTEVCAPVVEAGPGYTSLLAVREEPAGGGPLRALLAGVDALATDGPVLLLACDMPFVEVPLVRLLVDHPAPDTVIPRTRARIQYGCARYGPAWLARARAAGTSSFKSVRDDDVEYLEERAWHTVASPHALDDVDGPEDLARSIQRETPAEPAGGETEREVDPGSGDASGADRRGGGA
jgi:molybdopterin-guanine dinucleotide biosynthesis protein A